MAKTLDKIDYLLIFVIISSVSLVDCKVYSNGRNTDPLKRIKLEDGVTVDNVLRRYRRDTNTHPKRSENQLGQKDEGYNEAIVHWSGDESDVNMIFFPSTIQ